MDFFPHYASPLGDILLAGDGEGLTGLWFAGQKLAPAAPDEAQTQMPLPVFAEAARWLDIYFSGKAPAFTPPLHLRGTPFQRAVWTLLLSIPYGTTVTYGEIAARIAREMNLPRVSPRAVGGAVGRNPVSLIVPCHRVIGADGRLTGYAGGLERKRWLLRLESVPVPDPPASGQGFQNPVPSAQLMEKIMKKV